MTHVRLLYLKRTGNDCRKFVNLLHANTHSGSTTEWNKVLLEFLCPRGEPPLRVKVVRIGEDFLVVMRVPDVHAHRGGSWNDPVLVPCGGLVVDTRESTAGW